MTAHTTHAQSIVIETDVERPTNLTTKEGWREWVKAPKRLQPTHLSMSKIRQLSDKERYTYNQKRSVWHANLGPYQTTPFKKVIGEVDLIVSSNQQDGDKVRSSVVLDAAPGLGKTTLALRYGSDFHKEQVTHHGDMTHDGHERVPVAYIRLAGKPTTRTLNEAMCTVYAHPTQTRINATNLGIRAAESARLCQTRLIIVDDLHFLNMNSKDGREVANQFKWLANESPATFFFVGVGLNEHGLLNEGLMPSRQELAQIARRWTATTLKPFALTSKESRWDWKRLLLGIERDLVLANKEEGMLAESLSDYLFARTQGHFASLMPLISRACHLAIKEGKETLTESLLEACPSDIASERGRKRHEAAVRNALPRRRESSHPRRQA